jgi:ATP-binding cassette subfamily B protein AbcA/BmrA
VSALSKPLGRHVQDEPAARPAEPSLRHLAEVVRTGRPPMGLILVAVTVSLLEIGSTLAFPVITRALIDGLGSVEMTPAGLLGDIRVQMLLAVLLIGAFAGAIAAYLLAKAGLAMGQRLKLRLVEKLLALPVSYFDERQSGEHASRITKDTDVVSGLVTMDFQHLVSGTLLMIGSAVILSMLDVHLALTVFGIIIGAFLLMVPVLAGMAKITLALNDRAASLTGILSRTFGEIRLVKAFGAEGAEQARSEQEIAGLYRHGLAAARIQASLQPMVSLALTLAVLAIFTYGGARVAMGTLSTGTLTAFVLYIFNIVAPLIQLSMFFSHLQSAKGASLRISAILASRNEVTGVGFAVAGPVEAPASADLAFHGVQLVYGGRDRAAFNIEHLVIPARSSVAIVGPSGAGKTSLFSLIERFYAPTEGMVSWDGVDIASLPLVEWRRMLGYVPQSPRLMAGTVRENIAYGLPAGVDPAAVAAAAEAANCLDFIAEMPGGLDGQVGDGGSYLSGGQRQRVAIARMFLRNPSILMMDEATSSLDGESEAIVLNALQRLMIGRTALVITHRWLTLHKVDYVAVIEAGELREFGRTADVISQSAYCKRVRAQSMAEAWKAA